MNIDCFIFIENANNTQNNVNQNWNKFFEGQCLHSLKFNCKAINWDKLVMVDICSFVNHIKNIFASQLFIVKISKKH